MRVKILTVYKNSSGKQVAVDVQDCDTNKVVFVDINFFIDKVVRDGYEKDNFIIVGDRVQGKNGVNLHFDELLTYSEIQDKYKNTNVKLGRVIRHNNKPLGAIVYASVIRTADDHESELDEIENRKNGVEVTWLCTRSDLDCRGVMGV